MRRSVIFFIALVLVAGAYVSSIGGDANICELQRSVPRRGVVYFKSQRRLCVYEKSAVVLAARASHGFSDGAKHCEGDRKTPEGSYTLSPGRASAEYGQFFSISYPTKADQQLARELGCNAGDGIGIHGPQEWYAWLGEAHSLINHSDGCIVVDREALQRLDAAVARSTSIRIER